MSMSHAAAQHAGAALPPGPDEAPVTATTVDLTNCDRELVHMPGMIQPHGAMLVLRQSDSTILQASENTAALFGRAAPGLAGQGLAAVLGDAAAARVSEAIAGAAARLEHGPLHLLTLPPDDGREAFEVFAHRAVDVLVIELERGSGAEPCRTGLTPDLAACIARLKSASGLQAFLDQAVSEISDFTGFDRVMAFRFTEDGGGSVVAEARRNGQVAYLGKHFPPSDLPLPARRLLTLSWLRYLPDAEYAPVRLLPDAGAAVDMSRALLRHVSVMYTGWLKNIGARATLVMPLLQAGRPWGLISCMHHAGPRRLACETRNAIEILAHTVSLQIAEREAQEVASYRGRLEAAVGDLAERLRHEADYRRALCRDGGPLQGCLDASGVALVTDDGIARFGTTPPDDALAKLAAWLDLRCRDCLVFATDRLTLINPEAAASKAVASGLLTVRLTKERAEFVMWFRPEVMRTVNWAGDPRKPVQVDVIDGAERLTPRVSFELWQETVRGQSAPWLACETEAAGALQQVVAEAILVRLNEGLLQNNKSLDNFAYIASHDLKEPLRGIHNYSVFLQRGARPNLTEEERGYLATIIRLTQRMDDLTDALLRYAGIGHTDLLLERVDVNDVVRLALEQLEHGLATTGTVVHVADDFPSVRSDRIRLAEVFGNLINNALKYNDRPAGERAIEIGWRTEQGHPVFSVSDNGIGLEAKDLETIFDIFRRLHARTQYGGGSGAGLTIARRTVERLGGRLWAESAGRGCGATFLFTLGDSAIESRAA